VSKRSTGKPPSMERIWEGAGLGLDVSALYPVLSENPTEVRRVPLARRGPGRPPWTEAEFLEHLRESQSKAAPSNRLADIAAQFRDLHGEIGVTPDHLRRLLRSFRKPAEIPE
jgi:hypothetical protein